METELWPLWGLASLPAKLIYNLFYYTFLFHGFGRRDYQIQNECWNGATMQNRLFKNEKEGRRG